MAAAVSAVEIASSPKDAPTTWDDSSSSSKDKEPIRIWDASVSAAWNDSMPSIDAVPPLICSFTLGLLIVSPSYTIGIFLPIFSPVRSAKTSAASSVNCSSTIALFTPLSVTYLAAAVSTSSPVSTTLPSGSLNSRDPGVPRSSKISFASVTPGIATVIRSLPSLATVASVLYSSTRLCSL